MPDDGYRRKLVAILSADAKDYSRLMSDDEAGTVRTIKTYFRVFSDAIQKKRGRVVDASGDNLLAEFASVVDAVRCAVEIQSNLKSRNEELPEDRRMDFRIGVNLGDVIEEEGRIYGDGVNIAARIQQLSQGGGITLSGIVYDQVKNKLPFGYEFLGEHSVKNLPEPVRVFRLMPDAKPVKRWRAGFLGAARWKIAMIAAVPGVIVAAVAVAPWRAPPRSPPPAVETAAEKRAVLSAVSEESTRLPSPVRSIEQGRAGGRDAGEKPRESASVPHPPVQRRPIENPPPVPREIPVARNGTGIPLQDPPSIAVLSFENLGGNPDEEYFSDGIADEIIAALSKLPGLLVISKSATWSYKRNPAKGEQVCRDLGARYVLEGNVQRSENRIRINAQILDATTGRHVWAQRYDRTVAELFWTRDQLVLDVAAAMVGNLSNREVSLLVRRSTDKVEAWEALQRGNAYYERYNAKDNLRAREWYEKAAELDPKFAAAWTMIGWTYCVVGHSFDTLDPWEKAYWEAGRMVKKGVARMKGRSVGTEEARGRAFKKAVRLGEKVRAMDPSYHGGYFLLSGVHMSAGRHEEVVANGRKAVELAPNDALAAAILASGLNYAGRAEEAIPLFQKAMRLNPRFPPWYSERLGLAYHLTGQHANAIETLKAGAKRDPKSLDPHLQLAVIYAEQGRDDEMRAEAAHVLRINPKFSIEAWVKFHAFKDPRIHENRKALMAKAGLPE